MDKNEVINLSAEDAEVIRFLKRVRDDGPLCVQIDNITFEVKVSVRTLTAKGRAYLLDGGIDD